MALYDWTSEKQANTYTAAANRKRLAAEAAKRLVGRSEPEQKLPHQLPHRKNSVKE
jgi:hypothetical protein